METKENKHQEYKQDKNSILFLYILTLVLLSAVMIFLLATACITNKGVYVVFGMAVYGTILFVSLICRHFMNVIKHLKNRVEEAWDNNRYLYTRINYLERELNRSEEYICELQLGLPNKSMDVRDAINKAKPKFEAAVTKACNDYRDELIKNIMAGEGGIYEQKKY